MDDMKEIYLEYAGAVKKYVMTLCHNEDLADDITAEVFLKAVKQIHRYDGRVKVLTWLCTIAKHTYIDYCRKKSNQETTLEDWDFLVSDTAGPEEAAEQNQRRVTLFKLLQTLQGEYKDVIYLRIFADLSFREIGDIFGKSENWARVTFYRAKTRLKGMMDDEI